jgi:sulfonate transport system permease protein
MWVSGRLRGLNWLNRVNWLGLGLIVVLVLIWQLLVSTGIMHNDALSSPHAVFEAGRYLISAGLLFPALLHTIRCVAIAWAIAVVVGGAFGLALALNTTVASWSRASIDLLRSLPVVAFVPIAILIWGVGSKSEVILGAYAGVWPMLINTASGVLGLPQRMREVALTLQLSRRATLTKIIVPSTGASMIVGARLALAASLVICVVSEMTGLQAGIGNQLVLEEGAAQPSRMLAYVFVVGLLGLLANAGLVNAIRRAFPGITALTQRSTR